MDHLADTLARLSIMAEDIDALLTANVNSFIASSNGCRPWVHGLSGDLIHSSSVF
jgi:hypothetical protein